MSQYIDKLVDAFNQVDIEYVVNDEALLDEVLTRSDCGEIRRAVVVYLKQKIEELEYELSEM